jgi:hypothetical protein
VTRLAAHKTRRAHLNSLTDNKTLLLASFVLMLLGVVTCATKTQHAARYASVAIGCFAVTTWAWRNKGDWPMRGASAFNFFACAGFYLFQR